MTYRAARESEATTDRQHCLYTIDYDGNSMLAVRIMEESRCIERSRVTSVSTSHRHGEIGPPPILLLSACRHIHPLFGSYTRHSAQLY